MFAGGRVPLIQIQQM